MVQLLYNQFSKTFLFGGYLGILGLMATLTFGKITVTVQPAMQFGWPSRLRISLKIVT